jgi:ADP-heptose:LPS heptosyltransferase
LKPKLLVVELWGLGDLVIATPFLQAASQKYAVTLLAKPYAMDLQKRFWQEVSVVPFVAPWTAFKYHNKYRLWNWPWIKMFRLRKELAAQRFDCALGPARSSAALAGPGKNALGLPPRGECPQPGTGVGAAGTASAPL